MPAGDAAPDVVVVLRGQAELSEVAGALRPVGGVADLLDGRQQHAAEGGEDGDDHQQFQKGEPGALRTHESVSSFSRGAIWAPGLLLSRGP